MTIDKNKNILIMLANTGQCYAKLSYKSHKEYDQIQSGLSLPVIFLSTIIGTASFTGLSIKYYFYMSMIIGFVNILISILTTILRYFKISEYNKKFIERSRIFKSLIHEQLQNKNFINSKVFSIIDMLNKNMQNEVINEGYDIYEPEKIFTNSEILRKLTLRDYTKLYTTALSVQSFPLMFPSEFSNLFEEEKNKLDAKLDKEESFARNYENIFCI